MLKRRDNPRDEKKGISQDTFHAKKRKTRGVQEEKKEKTAKKEMKLTEFYKFAVKKGIEKDYRGRDYIKKKLKEEREKYQKLSEPEKKYFDKERFNNPYPDTRILYPGKGTEKIKSIMVGIDIETQEILLAHMLRTSGKRIDAVVSHHPEGKAYATFYEVMHMQADILHKFGVPINIAESLMEPRIKEVSRKVMPINHTRAVDAARLLDIPFICLHTISDNHVTHYLQKIFDRRKVETVGDVIDVLESIEEYRIYKTESVGPTLLVGSKDRRCGKIFVDMTGGTEGSHEALEKLADSGVGTIITMHMSEEHYKSAEKYHLNVVIAGHMASDTLGMNLFLDEVEKKFGKIDVLACSGFRRIKHRR